MGNSCSGGSSGGGGSKATANSTHTVYVKTGDKKGADTDGNIFVCMADENGVWCEEKIVDTKWKNDFEVGSIDEFHLELPDIGRVTELCIRRDETAVNDSWYLERVIVETKATKTQSIFPVNRWIHAKNTVKLMEFDSALPQLDKNAEQRADELERKRSMYTLKQSVPGAPQQIESLPDDESFSNDYQWDIQKTKLKLFAQTKYVDLTTANFKHLDDFNKVYKGKLLPLPYGAKNWRSDEEFGNQRLSGCNPVMLKLCSAIPEHFPVTAEMVEPFLEEKSLQECLDQKKLYLVDLRYLADVECTGGRKLCGPTGLFYSKKCGDLVPIAIQLMPAPADDNPVFLPSDPEYTWLAVKVWFNMADASHHQSVTHLGFTHLAMETVAVCTHRQLSPSHPIFRLLAPHFIYLLAINTLAVNKLVSPDGWVDECMHVGRTGMFEIIKHNWAEWDLREDGNILNDFQKRGVDDAEALPNYHYRDDATLLWHAITKYVSTVVNQVYDSQEKLSGDHEIQAWAKEISDANFKGMVTKFSTTEELSEVITTFIFIGSVGHAAANFCQYDEYAFPPNYPAMLVGERPTDKTALTEEYIVKSLPPKAQTLSIMIVTKLLSERGTNELTNFEVQYAYDPITLNALKQFKTDLKEIGTVIDGRNAKRTRKYPYLHPQAVPNAISI